MVWHNIGGRITEGITLCSQSDRSAFNNHAPYIQLGMPFIKYLYGEFIANVKDPISFFGQNQRKRRGRQETENQCAIVYFITDNVLKIRYNICISNQFCALSRSASPWQEVVHRDSPFSFLEHNKHQSLFQTMCINQFLLGHRHINVWKILPM